MQGFVQAPNCFCHTPGRLAIGLPLHTVLAASSLLDRSFLVSLASLGNKMILIISLLFAVFRLIVDVSAFEAKVSPSPAMATEGTPSQVTRYTIIPEDGRNTTAVEEYEGILFSLVEKKLVYTSKCDELGVVFWWTKLSPQQAKELEHPFVCISFAIASHHRLVSHNRCCTIGDHRRCRK